MPGINKRAIDALIARRERAILRDDELRGFACRLNRNGSVSYYIEYRAGRGRRFPVRRFVIGRHGPFTPDEARQRAKTLLAQVACGRDPARELALRQSEPTIRDLLVDTLERHWRPKSKASTVKSFEDIINGRLIPTFGGVHVSDLRRADVRKWHSGLKGIPVRANRSLAVLRKALSFALADELIPVNPAFGIKPHREIARDRVPSDTEIRALWRACEDPRISTAGKLFRLLLLTGCRSGELRTARREWLVSGNTLRLPDAKSGARGGDQSIEHLPWLRTGAASSRGARILPYWTPRSVQGA
jgi:integrase